MCNLNKTGVYMIKNKVNGKVYIGATMTSFKKRFSEHISYLNNCLNGKEIRRSYNKDFIKDWSVFGEDNFEFKILKVISDKVDRRRLYKYESIYIIRYNSKFNGYNNVIQSHGEQITVRYDIYGKNPKIIYFTNQRINMNCSRNLNGVGISYSNFEYYYVRFKMDMIDSIPKSIPTKVDAKELVIMLLDSDFNLIFKTSNRDKLYDKIKSMNWSVPINKKRLADPIRKFTFCFSQYFIIRECDINNFIQYLSNRVNSTYKYEIKGDINNLIKLSKEIV